MPPTQRSVIEVPFTKPAGVLLLKGCIKGVPEVCNELPKREFSKVCNKLPKGV